MIQRDPGMERLLSALVTDAIVARDVNSEIQMSKLECAIYGRGVCHCPECGAIVGLFPCGVTAGARYGTCRKCDPDATGDRLLFFMRHGYVRDSYYGCGHEYAHGDADAMRDCPACTGEAPELLR